MFPDKIFDVWASIYTTISTFKAVNPSIYVRKCRSTPSHWDLENQKNTKGSPLWKWKKFLSPILMKFKTCNPYGLRISHTKFEWNQRQKFFPDSKGGPFDDFLKIRKIPKGPPFGKKKFLSPILLKFYVWDPETIRISDFEFHHKKKFFDFFPFSPNARGPPKIFNIRFFKFFGKKCQK